MELLARGPERLSVAEVDGLLYKAPPAALLERALRVPALSPGWRRSFEDLLRAVHAGPALEGFQAAARPR